MLCRFSALVLSLWWLAAPSVHPANAQAAKDAPGTNLTPPTTQPLPALSSASVSIPWNELLQLIEKGKGAADRPPVDFVFSPASYKAQVTDKGMKVLADVDVTLLTDGYALVPLGPADAGIISVTTGNDPAPVVLRDKTLFALLNGKGKKHLALTAERPVSADAGASRFELPLIPSPLVSLTVTIPATGLDVKVPGAAALQVNEDAKQTTVTAGYPGGATAAVSWKQRPAEAKQAARLYGDTETLVSVERGLMRSRSKVKLQVERGSVKQVKLTVDPKAVVLTVTGTGVATWSEAAGKDAAGGDAKTVTVEFGSAVDDERVIEIVTERDVPEQGGAMPVAPPAVEGARRDRGVLAVESRGGFEVRPGGAKDAKDAKDTGMERMSVSELPAPLRESAKGTLQIAYRYGGQPAAASLLLEKVKPQPAKVFALTQTRVGVDRGVLRCRAEVTYEILHAGVDTLRINLPPGVEFIGVTGNGVRNSQVVEENKTRTLVVGLKDVAKGAYSLVVDYDYPFDENKVDGAKAAPTGTGAPARRRGRPAGRRPRRRNPPQPRRPRRRPLRSRC